MAPDSASPALAGPRRGELPEPVILAEGEDPRVVAAAERAAALGLCRTSLVGARGAVAAAAAAAGVALTVPTFEPAADPDLPRLTAHPRRPAPARGTTPPSPPPWSSILSTTRPCAVALGLADGAVMGSLATTADTLRAALRAIGPRPGLRVVSSCFLMVLPENGGELGGRD